MFVKQVSVCIENREGRLEDVLNLIREQEINIISLSLADASDYGMLRLIVAEPEKALRALKENGFSATLTDVIALKIEHSVGKLQEALSVICQAGINIEYMYALTTGTEDASIAIKTSDPKKAQKALEAAGVRFFSADEMANS